MFSILNKKSISLLINIGNGSVNMAFIEFTKESLPNFLFTIDAPYISEKPDPLRLSDDVTSLLDSLLKTSIKKMEDNKYLTKFDKKIANVMITYSSPWLILKTKQIHIDHDTPFIITKEFIEDITLKEAEIFNKELIQEYQEYKAKKFEIIEKSIIHTKINGYTISNILGKKTKNLDASLFISGISQDINEKITNILLKHTHVQKEKVLFSSFPLVLFSTVRDHLEKAPNFVLMNISSETTDIILVSDHIINSVTSFPFGRNSIIRKISASLKLSIEIAESEFNMYLTNKIEDNTASQIEKILDDLENEWSIYLEDTLLRLSPEMILPKKTFVVAGDDVYPIFVNFLKRQKTDSTAGYRSSIDVSSIDKNALTTLYNNNNKMVVGDSITALTLFFDKLFKMQ